MSRPRVPPTLLALICASLCAGACGHSSTAPELPLVLPPPAVSVAPAGTPGETAQEQAPGATEDRDATPEEAARRGGSKYSVIFF